MQLLFLAAAFSTAALTTAQQVVTVQVGGQPGPAFTFSPNSITASNNTIVNFQFTGVPGNHTVTQSSFNSPCDPLPNGLDSGWITIPTGAPQNPPPSWNVTITNDQEPIWLFCKQLLPSPHCNGGMVAVINVKPGANSLEAFAANAKSASVGQGEGAGNIGVGASASADPFLPSGVVRVTAALASATTPSGSGASSGGSSSNTASAPGSSNTSGAVRKFNLTFLSVVGGAVAGAFVVML